jgi:hypothetical protein
MLKLEDETIDPILMGIALDTDTSVKKVREALVEYYKGIVHLVESGKPHQIKMDYFGKVKPSPKFAEIEEKIMLKFDRLTRRSYEDIPD